MMQIRVEFESLSEMKAFAKELIGCECNHQQEEPQELPADLLPKPEKKEEPKPAAEGFEPVKTKDLPEEFKPEDLEKRRVEVRALLHDLNKKAGSNIAKRALETLGFGRLENIDTIEDLNKLARVTKEVLEENA